ALPIYALRLGGTIQTPTFYSLNDDYYSAMQVNYKPGVFSVDNVSAKSLDGEFEYSLTTPFRASGGLAYFIGKYGFVSADVEYVNYGHARFSIADDNPYGLDPGTGYFSQQNRIIKDSYASAMNIRVGAEARLDVFRIRAGFARYGDPYESSNLDRARTYLTGGIGLKER